MEPKVSPEAETSSDTQSLAEPTPDSNSAVAPYWHTVLFVLLLLGISLMSAFSAKSTAQAGGTSQPALGRYLSTILMQWILFGLVWIGLRMRKRTLRDIFGEPWRSFDDFLMDVAIAAAVFVASLVVRVAIIAAAFGPSIFKPGASAGLAQQNMKALEALAPNGATEMIVALLLAITAGVVEEFIFRGYLQRQFVSLTRSAIAGILITTAIFTAGHLYQLAWLPITFVATLGLMMSILVHYRKNLRPAIILHIGQDAISLLLLGLFAKTLAK
jgi:membrane protease YdiL (CAAX protease family)